MHDLPNIMRLFLDATDHEITGGSKYQWSSYGSTARFIDCDNDLASCYAIYDSVSHVVYEVGVQSNTQPANYRWFAPDYQEANRAEAIHRNVAWDNPSDPAEPDYEKYRWKTTDAVEDICEKVHAIRNGLPYSPDVIMTLHMERDTIADLALMAHERDMTLNEFIVDGLRRAVARSAAIEKAENVDDRPSRTGPRKTKK